MAIITISRELAALSEETASVLAKALDYRLVEKNALEERIKSYGMKGPKLEKFDERKPSFWASLSQDRDDYLHYLKTAILEEAGTGRCIFIGRGAALILKNVPAVLSVFLAAPPDIRLERVKNYFHCDGRRAKQIIAQSDHDREGFHRYFFDTNWQDPANYHLTLNTGRLCPTDIAALIRNLMDRTVTEKEEAQSLDCLRELTLGQQVKHHILYDRAVPVHFLETSVSAQGITLYGVVSSAALLEAAKEAAREAAGTIPVECEIQVVQEYSLIPS